MSNYCNTCDVYFNKPHLCEDWKQKHDRLEKAAMKLREAALKVSTINVEYQADKSSGPFDMVYVKWKAEKQMREKNLEQAITEFDEAIKGDG